MKKDDKWDKLNELINMNTDNALRWQSRADMSAVYPTIEEVRRSIQKTVPEMPKVYLSIKCENCGAPLEVGPHKCAYCGSIYGPKKENTKKLQEQINVLSEMYSKDFLIIENRKQVNGMLGLPVSTVRKKIVNWFLKPYVMDFIRYILIANAVIIFIWWAIEELSK